ncbi:hypothetical protein WA026_017917 [Henosepilachna vigintioctopunctata]|uniref:SAP domain-containing protein n=1 Tax=Henosepilachna vigintioctopunctata TaxID=420089 RepID=A0AAW1TX95_9CUCU
MMSQQLEGITGMRVFDTFSATRRHFLGVRSKQLSNSTESLVLNVNYRNFIVFRSVIDFIMDCIQKKVAELKIELKNRGAKVTGTKEKLIERVPIEVFKPFTVEFEITECSVVQEAS